MSLPRQDQLEHFLETLFVLLLFDHAKVFALKVPSAKTKQLAVSTFQLTQKHLFGKSVGVILGLMLLSLK